METRSVGSPVVVLRKASVADAEAIAALIQPYAARDLMLPRPLPQLYEGIRDFHVACTGERLSGCVALHVFDAALGEIKSLAVSPDAQHQGLGTQLVQRALAEARALGLSRVFALVLRDGLYTRLGFQVVERDALPQKVWGECIFCPKFHRCDEVAVAIDV
ncbi:MAG: N-acetyltransferase [Armatimonadetes bacterium]|nr:N-acetyltransferase [Armatimonadota bacterium]